MALIPGWKTPETWHGSWQLLAGWGGKNLLDSYTDERHPVFASTRDDFIMKSILEDRAFIEAHDPNEDAAAFATAWEQATGDDSMVTQYLHSLCRFPIVWGALGARSGATGQQPDFEATIGHHLAPVVMSDGKDFWDKLGSYFTLIELTGNSDGVAKFDAAATSRGIPLNILEIEDPRL